MAKGSPVLIVKQFILPVGKGQVIVLAGPFASKQDAQANGPVGRKHPGNLIMTRNVFDIERGKYDFFKPVTRVDEAGVEVTSYEPVSDLDSLWPVVEANKPGRKATFKGELRGGYTVGNVESMDTAMATLVRNASTLEGLSAILSDTISITTTVTKEQWIRMQINQGAIVPETPAPAAENGGDANGSDANGSDAPTDLAKAA